MSTRWDAETYERVSDPQRAWAEAVIARLELRGDERILDAGCGSGGITARLAELVPDGEVVGVDASAEMVELARSRHPGLEITHRDLLDLDYADRFDVVFSNAVFHWITDHDRLFGVLARALRPAGRLEAQCGGYGNVQSIKALIEALAGDRRFSEHLAAYTVDWNFARPADTETRLRKAGFEAATAWLEETPVQPDHPIDYLRTVCLRQPLELLPPPLRDDFIEAVVARVGRRPTIDYVRLNIAARLAG